MVSGLAWPDDEEFDPVKHFDLDRSTMTIDTRGTNMAMRDFATSSWAGIREVIMAVPLSHPLWQIDPAVGLEGWVGAWHNKLPTPQPPVLPFNIKLQPIDPWMDSDLALQPLQCAECPELADFQTIGLLVQHYRTHHAGEDCHTFPASGGCPSAEQDKIDEAFWKCECPYCGAEFKHKGDLTTHWKEQCEFTESNTLSEARRLLCTVCPEEFSSIRDRNDHLGTTHGQKVYRCAAEGCNAVFLMSSHFVTHERHMHKTLKCRVRKCPDKFRSEEELADHIITSHSATTYKCPTAGCGKVFVSPRGLKKHKRKIHNQESLDCKYCHDKFQSSEDLTDHIATFHPASEEFRCTVDNCNEMFATKNVLTTHERKIHSKGLLNCRKGCSATFVHGNTRLEHEREQHPEIPE
jgi:hypothetical protein